MKALLLSALALVVLLNSCDSGGRPVPRPEGYPRIALYEAVYRNDSIGPVIFESNAGTAVTERRQGADGTGWLTLAYPRYGATLYLTASPATASTLGGIIDNRLERISLNIGGATTELTELTGKGGWHGRVTLPPSDTRHFAARRLRCQRSAFPRKSGYSHFSRLAGTRSRSRPR